MLPSSNNAKLISAAVIVAALGYFVDIYDLLLFTIVKKASVLAVGATAETLLADSTKIINWQMGGLLLGGILWGIMGDKKGRLSVLFGSILIYSVANFITGYVTNVAQYALCRFVAGVGLAGELGAGITLVAEILPKNKRGIGTSLVAGIGLSGAVFAYFTYKFTNQDWRLCYKLGGLLGFALLLLRIGVAESGMYAHTKNTNAKRGNFLMLFNNLDRFKKYVLAILIGLPTWFVIGILVNQSDKFAEKLYGSHTVDSGKSIMLAYAAIAVGDILVGVISHWFKSRKKALLLYYIINIIGIILFFNTAINNNDAAMYSICMLLGFSTGYWAIFVTMGAEHFGTNLRATAATTIPNMVRGLLPLINILCFDVLKQALGYSLVNSAIITAVIVMAITLTAFYFIPDTYHKDLDFIEE